MFKQKSTPRCFECGNTFILIYMLYLHIFYIRVAPNNYIRLAKNLGTLNFLFELKGIH